MSSLPHTNPPGSPFSHKIYDTLVAEVKPHYTHKLELIFQPMPQPWHPASCMVHESFHAACLAAPLQEEQIFASTMRTALLHFGDSHTLEMSRRQVHEQISSIYEAECGVEKAALLRNLALDTSDGQINGGNNATRILKFYAKQHRQLGIHVVCVSLCLSVCVSLCVFSVYRFALPLYLALTNPTPLLYPMQTPSVRVNNVCVDSSSSWSLQDWCAFLDPLLGMDYM